MNNTKPHHPAQAHARSLAGGLLLALLLLAPAHPASARAQDDAPPATQRELVILAFHRPPYYTFANGRAGGFLVDFVRRVMEVAGIPYRISEMPPKRILVQMEQDDQAYACSPGWYRTPQREAFARFSVPIYHNLPPVVVLRSSAVHAIQNDRNLETLLAAGLRVVLRGGFSYGSAIDETLAASAFPIHHTTTDNASLLEMLASGRYDLTLMEQEEATELLRQSPRLRQTLRLAPLGMDAEQQPRHLMCGRGVDDDTMRRINAAVTTLTGAMPPPASPPVPPPAPPAAP